MLKFSYSGKGRFPLWPPPECVKCKCCASNHDRLVSESGKKTIQRHLKLCLKKNLTVQSSSKTEALGLLLI